MRKTKALALLLAVVMLFSLAACSSAPENKTTESTIPTPANPTIRVSTTTSVNDSGLLPYLQPYFEKETGYKLEITSNGTGAAIKLGETGDCDVLLVHAKASEEEFVANGYGVERIPFMYNYFVLVGAADDAAKVKDCANATEAFKKIATAKSTFVSRGDDSGTHKAELKIWKAAELTPGEKDAWYISAGTGMGATLTQANERKAYCLTDKGTFLSNKANLTDLSILLEKGDDMKNTYSLIAVNPAKNEGINSEGADAFIKWMTNDSTLELIKTYGVDKYGQALFYIIEK